MRLQLHIVVDTHHIWNEGCWCHWGTAVNVKPLWRRPHVAQPAVHRQRWARVQSDSGAAAGWLTLCPTTTKKLICARPKGHLNESILCFWQLIDLFSRGLHWKKSKREKKTTGCDGHSVKIWSIFMIFKGQKTLDSLELQVSVTLCGPSK